MQNFPMVLDVSRAITSEPSKSKKQTLLTNSTAFVWRLARLGDTRLVLARAHGRLATSLALQSV